MHHCGHRVRSHPVLAQYFARSVPARPPAPTSLRPPPSLAARATLNPPQALRPQPSRRPHAHLIYAINASLDGYIEDANGNFDWTEPDEELHLFFNDLLRPIGTELYGRRMYETMAVWETDPSFTEDSEVLRDFAEVWQAADKIVYSTTLGAPLTARTRIERTFDSEAVRRLKAESSPDLAIGGPELAAHAFRAGLIDECHLVLHPVAVGAGKPALPRDFRLDLELLHERRFNCGVVDLHYRVRRPA
ncbi:MAG: dihydrofolate reductase family protein [Dehalococcoidia bacterium]